jgi:DNA-binding NtrC family response regulator
MPSRILILEDEQSIADMLILTLRDAGFECDHAEGLKAALSLLRGNGYSAIITDLRVPGSFGYDTIEAVATASHGAAIIVGTGFYIEREALEAMERFGVSAYLDKNCDYRVDNLIRVVKEAIARSRYRGQVVQPPKRRISTTIYAAIITTLGVIIAALIAALAGKP